MRPDPLGGPPPGDVSLLTLNFKSWRTFTQTTEQEADVFISRSAVKPQPARSLSSPPQPDSQIDACRTCCPIKKVLRSFHCFFKNADENNQTEPPFMWSPFSCLHCFFKSHFFLIHLSLPQNPSLICRVRHDHSSDPKRWGVYLCFCDICVSARHNRRAGQSTWEMTPPTKAKSTSFLPFWESLREKKELCIKNTTFWKLNTNTDCLYSISLIRNMQTT